MTNCILTIVLSLVISVNAYPQNFTGLYTTTIEGQAAQISLNQQDWKVINRDTTILLPHLNYFIELVIKVNNKVLQYINNSIDYKKKLLEMYADEWTPTTQE